ncbi:hypothetical protein INH39_07760 [Massilia violaceinigra]|uniref:DUF4382 domain-containing protein n=1 Tax=Massilia violaceinigra TaxID=2045208 RepID=A0ABY4AA58_9BURK|nr:hypothetical protein [Massilia violaceinigra]UOD31573.1 hypothetical protein INH39_07760 [Massilia violaceinigra]
MSPIRSLIHFLALFLVVGLGGCASKSSLLGEPTPLAKPGFGYVAVVMVAREDSSDSTYTLHDVPTVVATFVPVGTPGGSGFQLHTGANGEANGIWFDPKSKTPMMNGYHAMQLIPVQVGSYRLKNLLATMRVYQKQVSLNKLDTPPFTVREGEVTYIGSIGLNTSLGKNLIGMTTPAGLRVAFVDNFETDWAAMQKADARLTTMKVTNGLGTAAPK